MEKKKIFIVTAVDENDERSCVGAFESIIEASLCKVCIIQAAEALMTIDPKVKIEEVEII